MKIYLENHLNSRRIIFLLSVAILTIIFSLIFIKFLGDIFALFNADQAADILRQLKHQKLFIPFYVPLVFIFINFIILEFFKNHSKLRIFLLILSIFIGFLLTVFLSMINNILIMKVLWKIVMVLSKGSVSL